MASYNKVLLMGNLTRDIEVRQIGSGQSVANFGLAVTHKYRTAAGENREETTFVDCEMWGKRGEAMARYLSKGKPVFIEGRLKLDTWQDKNDGSNRSKLRVVAESFEFIDSRGGGDGGGNQGGGAPKQASNAGGGEGAQGGGGGNENYGEPVSADDIPF